MANTGTFGAIKGHGLVAQAEKGILVAPGYGVAPGGDDPFRLVHQGVHPRKFSMSARPSDWLFSGWNWVPKMLSRPTMAVIGPP